jgi:hypothetical protein
VHELTNDREQAFRDLVREIIFKYADQVTADWHHFVAALDLPPEKCGRRAFTPPSYRNMLPR